MSALPSELQGTISIDIHNNDAAVFAPATNYAMNFQTFTAEVVLPDGTKCEGLEVMPAEGKFGPKNSEPSKEKDGATGKLLRPYGATINFQVSWKMIEPALAIQNVGAVLGAQRVWNNETFTFPTDAHLLVKTEEEDLAWKLDFVS